MTSAMGAVMFFAAWCVLAVVLFGTLLRMLRNERDVRVAAEDGKTPEIELFGRANINRSSWSMKNMARLSLYDTFLVASCRSRRIHLSYENIENLEEDRFRRTDGIRIGGPKDDSLHRPDIRFAGPDAEQALAFLVRKTKSGN